jgi:hypothetical protein
LHDGGLINKYGVFILEVVKAHAPKSPEYPRAMHCRDDGAFMLSGPAANYRRKFRPGML